MSTLWEISKVHVKHDQPLQMLSRTILTCIAQNSVIPIEQKYITVAMILHGDIATHQFRACSLAKFGMHKAGTWANTLIALHLPFSIIFLTCVIGPDKNIVLQKDIGVILGLRFPCNCGCICDAV